MIPGVVIITFLVALACGGRIKTLEKADIKHVWLFPAGLVFLIGLDYLQYRKLLSPVAVHLIQPSIYLFIISALILNRHLTGALTLAFGTFLNFLAITANGGYMPVSPAALQLAGMSMEDLADTINLRHSLMDAQTRLAFLGDVIPVPWPHLLRCVISIGDIVVMIALAVMVWRLFFPLVKGEESS